MKNAIKKRWPLLLLFFICFMIVVVTLLTTPGDFGLHSEKVVRLYPGTEYSTSGLEESGNVFTPTSDDPQMVFSIAPGPVRSVTLFFETPLEQNTDIQVFYASEGEEFSKENSTRTVAGENSTECPLILPGEQYSRIRLNIDGRVELKEVLANESFAMLYAKWICVALLAVLIVIAAVFIAFNWKAERLYPACALLLGLLYLVALTPLSAPDEQHHYQTAYELSNAILFQADKEVGNSAAFDYANFTLHHNTPTGYSYIVRSLDAPAEVGSNVRIPKPRDLSYFPMHLPQALGITLARLLGFNFIWTFWMGRLFNLLFYVLCTYWAIRMIPRFKALFFLVALAPMSLHQAASYSYDAFVIALSLLLLAFLIKAMLGDGAQDRRSLGALLAANVLLTPAKVVYYPISALTLLIPKTRFKNNKTRWMYLVAIFLLPLMFMLLFRVKALLGMAASTGISMNWGGRHVYTISFLLSHPVRMVKLFVVTALEKWMNWLKCAVGFSLSGLTLQISEGIPFVYIALLILSGIHKEREYPSLRVRERCSFGAVVLVVSGLIMLSILLDYTPDTSPVIVGVQGRYFIPLLPLAVLIINNDSLGLKRNLDKALMMLGGMLNIMAISQIVKLTLMG